MAIGDPPNRTKPWWLGNQNGFVRFPWFICHDASASLAGVLGGGDLELAPVLETREPHGTRERYADVYSAALDTHSNASPFLHPASIWSPARDEGNTLALEFHGRQSSKLIGVLLLKFMDADCLYAAAYGAKRSI